MITDIDAGLLEKIADLTGKPVGAFNIRKDSGCEARQPTEHIAIDARADGKPGIDLWSFARLTETFEQIHREGEATMIIISHQERIIRLADEIVVIAGGKIAHRGSTEEIFPLILADTLGSCPVLERKEAAQ